MTDRQIDEAIERMLGREPCDGWFDMFTANGPIPKAGCDHPGDTCYPINNPRPFCTDPAAWGALLVWLASERLMPKLRWDEIDAQWVAQVGRSALYELGRDAQPGRALALAALRAHGVEV